MLTNANLQIGLFVVALLILVKPFGLYMALAADGKAPLLSRIGSPFEVRQRTQSGPNRFRQSSPQDGTDQCQLHFAATFSTDSRTALRHQICADRLTHSDLPVRAKQIG